jgi:hypothetical protein
MSQDTQRTIKRAPLAVIGFVCTVVLIGGAVIYAFLFSR